MEHPTARLQKRIQKLAKSRGTLRSKDLNEAGIARSQLSKLVAAGQLNRIARGLYTLPDSQGGEHQRARRALIGRNGFAPNSRLVPESAPPGGPWAGTQEI